MYHLALRVIIYIEKGVLRNIVHINKHLFGSVLLIFCTPISGLACQTTCQIFTIAATRWIREVMKHRHEAHGKVLCKLESET